jgi:uncharacterized protein
MSRIEPHEAGQEFSMPLFCIHGLDGAGRGKIRDECYPAHRAFLGAAEAWGVRVAASGPLVSDDGTAMIGSLFIVEADSIEKVRAFNAADPFAQAGLWRDVQISRFDLRRGAVGAV